MFSIPTMTAADIVIPLPTTGSSTTMNAITGLTGYMTLGLGAKAKPAVVQTAESELLMAKDGTFIPEYMRFLLPVQRSRVLHWC